MNFQNEQENAYYYDEYEQYQQHWFYSNDEPNNDEYGEWDYDEYDDYDDCDIYDECDWNSKSGKLQITTFSTEKKPKQKSSGSTGTKQNRTRIVNRKKNR